MTALRKLILLAAFSGFALMAGAQVRASLKEKAGELKKLLATADELSPFEDDNDSIELVHGLIAGKLTEIMTRPAFVPFNLDSVLDFPSLEKVHSSDKRLWIFSWYENTGGSWKSNINLVHWRTRSGKLMTDFIEDLQESAQGFEGHSASFHTIYKLKSPNKDLYLCMGHGLGCSTCLYDVATVVELTPNGANFNYPAFRHGLDESGKPIYKPYFTLEARLDNIKEFDFDPATQTLSFVYLTDDTTPVQSDPPKRISRKLVFDGVKFRGKQK
jgi:hypothetical protein